MFYSQKSDFLEYSLEQKISIQIICVCVCVCMCKMSDVYVCKIFSLIVFLFLYCGFFLSFKLLPWYFFLLEPQLYWDINDR